MTQQTAGQSAIHLAVRSLPSTQLPLSHLSFQRLLSSPLVHSSPLLSICQIAPDYMLWT